MTRTTAITTSWVAITATIWTPEITVGELASVASWPTVDLDVAEPTSSDTSIRLPMGTTHRFSRGNGLYYGPGETVGYVRTASGSSTLAIHERAA